MPWCSHSPFEQLQLRAADWFVPFAAFANAYFAFRSGNVHCANVVPHSYIGMIVSEDEEASCLFDGIMDEKSPADEDENKDIKNVSLLKPVTDLTISDAIPIDSKRWWQLIQRDDKACMLVQATRTSEKAYLYVFSEIKENREIFKCLSCPEPSKRESRRSLAKPVSHVEVFVDGDGTKVVREFSLHGAACVHSIPEFLSELQRCPEIFYRVVERDSWEFGVNPRGVPNTRLIVKEPNEPYIVHEYSASRALSFDNVKAFKCLCCKARLGHALIVNPESEEPIVKVLKKKYHGRPCMPRAYDEVKRQQGVWIREKQQRERKLANLSATTLNASTEVIDLASSSDSNSSNYENPQKSISSNVLATKPTQRKKSALVGPLASTSESPHKRARTADASSKSNSIAATPSPEMAAQPNQHNFAASFSASASSSMLPNAQTATFLPFPLSVGVDGNGFQALSGTQLPFSVSLTGLTHHELSGVPTFMSALNTTAFQSKPEFNFASDTWLRRACTLLNLPYSKNAYRFWATMDVERFSLSERPARTHFVAVDALSGFRSLALLLTGSEEQTRQLKMNLNTLFFDQYPLLKNYNNINWSTVTRADKLFQDVAFSEAITSVHLEFLARIIGCRICVYVVRHMEWEVYGDPSGEREAVTILLENSESWGFRPVLKVEE